MRAMMVKIGFEIEQLAFEIGGCPEQRTIQALSAECADQPRMVKIFDRTI
jgi:hypothetical protein